MTPSLSTAISRRNEQGGENVLSEVCRSIEAGVENLPAQVSADIAGEMQKPVVVLLVQGVGRAVIAGKPCGLSPLARGRPADSSASSRPGSSASGESENRPRQKDRVPFLRAQRSRNFPRPCSMRRPRSPGRSNGGIRPVQLKSSIPVEVFQEVQGILFCRLPSDSVRRTAHPWPAYCG